MKFCFMALLLATAAPAFADGIWKYRSNPQKGPHLKPEKACDDWLAERKAMGGDDREKERIVRVEPTKDPSKKGYFDCVYFNQDFNKDDVVEGVVYPELTCPAGMRPVGQTDGSEKCERPRARATEEENLCDAKKLKSARKVTQAQAEQKGMQLAKKLVDDPFGKDMFDAYNAEKECVLAHENLPVFGEEDLYKGGPNDFNIGTLCGSYDKDFNAANALAGYTATPKGYTWHHHEDLGRMQLVSTEVHEAHGHFGGVSVWKRTFCTTDPAFRQSMCWGYVKERDIRRKPKDVAAAKQAALAAKKKKDDKKKPRPPAKPSRSSCILVEDPVVFAEPHDKCAANERRVEAACVERGKDGKCKRFDDVCVATCSDNKASCPLDTQMRAINRPKTSKATGPSPIAPSDFCIPCATK
jgi:hypothetical protein